MYAYIYIRTDFIRMKDFPKSFVSVCCSLGCHLIRAGGVHLSMGLSLWAIFTGVNMADHR